MLAKKFGFTGKVLPIIQAAGGFNFSYINSIYNNVPTSKRNKIVLKGYQNWAGRALVGLRALELCGDILLDYQIIILLPNPDVLLAAKLFSEKNKIQIEIIPNGTPHDDILRIYNSARIFIGLSISDGVPNSLLEAMVMGAFPIQSFTSCADEWIIDGVSGFLVPPEDSDKVAEAILKALTNDSLVDNAAEINWKTANERLDYSELKQKTIDSYKRIILENKL